MQKVYSVAQINAYIRRMFEQDFVLNRISIQGEISNCNYHSSGHIYFSLKDAGGCLSCIMFLNARKGLAFRMQEGQSVIVTGEIRVYERDGTYQLYAREIRLAGAGALYEKYLQLKQELEEMGMFAPEYKQRIPFYVRKLGVVTAPTGAAVRDIITVARRRNPWIQIVLYPALVQGEGAARSIAKGISELDRLGLDVIIVGRGGGSIEDLWAFNEEVTARAIFECHTPVISAVGHETDTTIADYVADLRAPTPSAAAELAVADAAAIQVMLEEKKSALLRNLKRQLEEKRYQLERLQGRLVFASPQMELDRRRQELTRIKERMSHCMERIVSENRHRMAVYAEKLKGLSPLEKLTQGFACVTDAKNRRIRSVSQGTEGERVTIHLVDGRMHARVEEIQEG